MDVDNVAIRLKGFIESRGLTHSQFADTCSIPRPTLSQLMSGRNKKVSDLVVGQIHKAFPELSVLWLLFGEGEMIDNSANSSQTVGEKSLFDDEIPELMGVSPSTPTRSNVSGLNTPSQVAQNIDYKRVDYESKIAELQMQIDKLRANPRKVSHITVYYDDSTFETFYPQAR
ncbi:MAG: helix-turn-helix domain-containing protein [Lepagella sp.]